MFFSFFFFACGGLVYFHCSFSIATVLIFQKQQAALHRSWRSGQICSGSLCFPGRDLVKLETTLLPGMFRSAIHNSEENKSWGEWHDTDILVHFYSFLSSCAQCSFHHYLWHNKRALPLTTTPKKALVRGLREKLPKAGKWLRLKWSLCQRCHQGIKHSEETKWILRKDFKWEGLF